MAERLIGDVVWSTEAIKREFFRWLDTPQDERDFTTQKQFAEQFRVSEPILTKWKREFNATDFSKSAAVDLYRALSDEELHALRKARPDDEDALDEFEFRKCEGDEEYFIRTHCKILSQDEDAGPGDGDPIPFELWEPQEEALVYFQTEKNAIVLKTRRLGISWLAVAHCLHHALYRKNASVLYRSITLPDANEQHERFKFMYDQLPRLFRDRVQTGPGRGLKRNDTESWFSNGSRLKMLTGSKSSGHGRSPTLLFWDEMSRDQNDVAGMRAIKPAVASGGRVIIVSTSDGPNNQFAKLYRGAKKGRNTFTPIFFAASRHPLYTPEFLEAERREYEDRGDLAGYYQAYPETEDEAWQAASSCPFDGMQLTKREKGIRPPVFKGMVSVVPGKNGEERFDKAENERGSLEIWEHPKKNRMYYMGVDVAQGLVGGDYSVFAVIDGAANKLVALYRAKIAPEMFAVPIEAVARYYNDALVAVESNKFDEVIGDLKDSYWNLFTRFKTDKPWDEPTLIVGWYTSGKSKEKVVFAIGRALSDPDLPLDIPSDMVMAELHTFEQDERKRFGAPKGEHDDCVMAMGIALAMRDEYRGREPIMSTEEPGIDDDDSALPVAAYDLSA